MAERRAEPEGCGSLEDIASAQHEEEAEANDRGDLRTATTTRRTDRLQEPRDNSNTTNEQPTSSHHSFTPSIHTTHSQHLFTAPIHSTHSHRMFTLAQPTMIVRPRPPGGTMVQPPGGGRNPRSVVGNHQRDYGPTGLRTNGSADAHRVLGADRESRSMMHE